jgi:predicted nucleic acid-binding protein
VSFLLDTNVLSEPFRPRPDIAVLRWLANVDEDRAFVGVATLAELRQGIDALAAGERRRRLEAWLEHDLPARFEGRILPVDLPVAEGWGRILARGRRAGRPIGVMDACLAAMAEVHGLTLVTRNTRDFANLGVLLLDPWRA